MNIQIRVYAAQALKQMQAVQAEQRAVAAQAVAANRAMSGMTGTQSLQKFGNQVQWAGRQLQYNFTVPILLAAGAATKFALDNEAAMTRLTKVYGDGTRGAVFYKNEIASLGTAFEVMSNHFGVARSDVQNIAADWAAAGSSGLALAKATKLTLETMILGEIDAGTATQSLIAIQAQYGQSVDDLSKTIDMLNMVENQTGVSMAGLIDGFSRAAGVARSAGVDTRHLAAMMAALVPASGGAAQAGNAIKTVLSRLLSPTKEAAQVMGLMGVNVKDLGWQSLNGSQRIEKLATTFTGLDDAQKAVVSSTIASRWQINKFDVLMRDIVNPLGYYQKALQGSVSASQNFTQKQMELNAVLQSSPQRIKQAGTILQNSLADVIVPLLPMIVGLAGTIAKLGDSFSHLDPNIQKLVGTSLLLLAAIGPVLRYLGSFATLAAYLAAAFVKLAKGAYFVLTGFRLMGTVFGIVGPALLMVQKAIQITSLVFFAAGVDMVKALWGARTGIVSALGAIGSQIAVFASYVASVFLNAMSTPVKAIFFQMLSQMYLRLAIFGLQARVVFDKIVGGILLKTLAFGTSLTGLWATMMGRLALLWEQFLTIITNIQVMFNRGMIILWGGLQKALAVIQTVGTAALLAIQRAYWTAVTVGWAGMQTALAAIQMWGSKLLVNAAAAGRLIFMTGWITFLATIRGLWAAMWAGMAAGGAIRNFFTFAVAMTRGGLVEIGKLLAVYGASFIRLLTGPWGLGIAAVIGILYAFRDDIGKIFTGVSKGFAGEANNIASAFKPLVDFFWKVVGGIQAAFNKLPEGVRNAFQTVVNIVSSAVQAVYKLFSYLNPFAHHSPSLVENVTNGMAAVREQYKSVANPALFAKAIRDIQAYKAAAASLGQDQFAPDRKNVADGMPSMLPMFDKLRTELSALNSVLAQQDAAVNRQQAVVDAWKNKLDAANTVLDDQKNRLDALQKVLDNLTSAYDSHQTALNNFASAPIVGMKAMDDQIFSNQQAVNKLQLQLLKMGDGGNIDALRSKFAALQGEIEQMRGDQQSLRAMGAGSDVLSTYDAQIKGLEDQQKAVSDTMGPVGDLAAQLAELQHQGQIMDLEKSIKFDPLIKQIKDAADTTKELSFDDIIAGIGNERSAMDKLSPQIAAATAAVDRQKAAVDQATAARDAQQVAYDRESKTLDVLKTQYDSYASTVRDVESALKDMGSAGSAAQAASKAAAGGGAGGAGAMSPGAENFIAAKGGNFPDVGGTANIGREGGLPDQSKAIDDWLKTNQKELGNSFGQLDMFGPIKDMWNSVWSWVQSNIGPSVSAVYGAITASFNNLSGSGGGFSSISDKFSGAWDNVKKWWDSFWPAMSRVLAPFADDFKAIFAEIVDAGKRIWNEVGPAIMDLFRELGPGLKIVAQIVGVVLIGALKIASSVLRSVIGPAINGVIDIILGIIKAVKGVVEFVTGVLTGNWSKAWQGIVDVVRGVWDTIFGLFNGVGRIIWGIIQGVVQGIVDWFVWMYEELVGHSVVPDMINAIVQWFKNLPGWVWNVIKNFATDMKTFFVNVATQITNAFSEKWTDLSKWLGGLWGLITGAMGDIGGKFKSWAVSAWNNVQVGFTAQWAYLKSWLQGAWGYFTGAMGDIGAKFKAWAVSAWNNVQVGFTAQWTYLKTWLQGIWGGISSAIGDIATKFKTLASGAMGSFFAGLKAIVDGTGANTVMGWIGALPGRMATALGGIGGTIANAVKGAWNSAAGWINSHGINNVNAITSKFGFSIPGLPGFAGGGIVPGRPSRTDNVLATLRSGEGVLIPEAVRHLGGPKGIGIINSAAKNGDIDRMNQLGVPAFADGGVLGAITGWLMQGTGIALGNVMSPLASLVRTVMPDGLMEDVMAGSITQMAEGMKAWGQHKDELSAAQGTGSSAVDRWSTTVGAVLDALGQNRNNTPAVLRLIQKESGGNSMAINLTDSNAMMGIPSKGLVQVIDPTFAAYGGSYIDRGIYDPFANIYAGMNYALARYGSIAAVDPLRHSGGYDAGGILKPGMTMAMNRSGKNEYVVTNPQMRQLSQLGSRLDRLEAKITQTGGYAGQRTVIINGDLVLPNIKNGNDAETFLKHLESLTGGA